MSAQEWEPRWIPTSIGCPPWCELPEGHPYLDDVTDPGLNRRHCRRRVHGGLIHEIAQAEHALSPEGPIERHPLESTLSILLERPWSTSETDCLDVGQDDLRRMAQHLTDAAEVLASLEFDTDPALLEGRP